MKAPEVIVAGGGIVGAACAYYLAQAGIGVLVLEREFFASGTSRACDGLILSWDKLSAAELELAQASAMLWADLAQALPRDFEYRRQGSIVLAETEEVLAGLRQKAADLGEAGIRAEVLDGAGLLTLEPNLAPDLAGGAFFPGDAQVDARQATLALLEGAAHLGAELRQGVEVIGLHRQTGGRVTGVLTAESGGSASGCGRPASGGVIMADAVVVAGGVWSSEMLREAGLELPIRPRKGHIVVASLRHAPDLIAHPLAEGSYAASVKSSADDVQVALIAEKTASDTLLLGSSREFCGFDRSVRVEIVQAIAARAIRFVPALAAASAIRSYAGLRPWSPDHLPLIGPVETHPGLFLATGHEGAGIGLAPVTGRMIADWIECCPHGYATGTEPGRGDTVSERPGLVSKGWSATWPGRFGTPTQLAQAPSK